MQNLTSLLAIHPDPPKSKTCREYCVPSLIPENKTGTPNPSMTPAPESPTNTAAILNNDGTTNYTNLSLNLTVGRVHEHHPNTRTHAPYPKTIKLERLLELEPEKKQTTVQPPVTRHRKTIYQGLPAQSILLSATSRWPSGHLSLTLAIAYEQRPYTHMHFCVKLLNRSTIKLQLMTLDHIEPQLNCPSSQLTHMSHP